MVVKNSKPATTQQMRLVSGLLGSADALPAFIAKHREPGENWKSWERLVFEIEAKTGELFTRESIRHWAMRYGIPTDTRRAPDAAEIKRYRKLITRAKITI